ncbi:MAG: T9SS type A sorting domain-containing protein [Bacteroidota bacterium]
MKTRAVAIFLLIFAGVACYSQSFSLADDFGELTNGADVFQSGPSDTIQLISWLHLTNKTGKSLQTLMKKEELNMLSGTNASICWAGYCYGPEVMISLFPLSISAGETVSGCFGHFAPNGSRGVSSMRWVFFNEANPNDSLSVTVHYSTFPSSVEKIPDQKYSLSFAGPIPATRQIIANFVLPSGKQGHIELINAAGKSVSHSGFVNLSGTVQFSVSDLPSGFYYCSLVVDGKLIITRKVPVSH